MWVAPHLDMRSGRERFEDRYAVTCEIGRGGCAVVYEARDLRLQRVVAIKLLHPKAARDTSAIERLEREGRVAAAIHHPNVCSVLDAGRLDDGRPYLVMERLYGETLRMCVARLGALPAEAAIDIVMQVLSGLEAAHALGIVHRDLKPDNVFVIHRSGCAPIVKILDFGLCRRVRSSGPDLHGRRLDDRTLTRFGTVVGTPEYMAPEQVSGVREFDGRIDLYAVGVMLYEALTGTRAFVAQDVRGVLVSVLSRSLPSLRSFRPDLPTILDRVVARAVERDPRLRYRSASELQRDLYAAREKLAHLALSQAVDAEPDWEQPTKQLRPRAVMAG
jgi:serine/threonine-protein kinase